MYAHGRQAGGPSAECCNKDSLDPPRTLSDRILLSALLSTANDGVVVWAADGSVTAWNPAAERLFGYGAEEALGQPIRRFFSSNGAAEVLRALHAPNSELAANTLVTEVFRKDGQRSVVSVQLVALTDPDAGSVGGVGVVRSASELSAPARGSAEGPVSADAERLSLALAAARLGDWSWDANTDRVTLSSRAAEIFGVPAVSSTTWTAIRGLLHEDDRERARVAVERALTLHIDYALEYRLVNGGRERWVSASGRGRYGPRGTAVGMFGVIQDITTDRILLRLDDAVRPLVKSEDITHTAAGVLGQYLDVDRCAYAFVEEDQDTFILTGNYTRGVHSIVGRYRFRQFGEECLRLMRAGEPYVVQDSSTDPRLDQHDRKAYAATAIRAVVCVPIVKSARFVAAMAVHMQAPRTWAPAEVELVQQVASRCWESIERARIESEREALLEAAESANRAKDEFLAMLGHELRNPLAPIVTALNVMKLKRGEPSERERTVIERQVRHLTGLVDDLLDVSRIARAKVLLKRERVELSEIVRRAVEVASPLLEQRAHTLEVDVPRTGLAVDGDVGRLTQVVSNLLTNAGKYTPSGGRIIISGATEEEQVVLRVRDTGMGIPADVMPRIFELFVQGRQSIDRAQGGLGLGLSIVRSLVESHGGRVSAYSEGQDRGSEFVVRLPRGSEVGGSIYPAEAERSGVRNDRVAIGRRILVVDDNVDGADMLRAALALEGCEVHVAHDGPRALQLAEARSFDAALLDIGLPVMDGYELAARLRELPNFRETRLIAVTGYGQESDRRRAIAAGFDHHCVKPVDLALLGALLNGLDGAPGGH